MQLTHIEKLLNQITSTVDLHLADTDGDPIASVEITPSPPGDVNDVYVYQVALMLQEITDQQPRYVDELHCQARSLTAALEELLGLVDQHFGS